MTEPISFVSHHYGQCKLKKYAICFFFFHLFNCWKQRKKENKNSKFFSNSIFAIAYCEYLAKTKQNCNRRPNFINVRIVKNFKNKNKKKLENDNLY